MQSEKKKKHERDAGTGSGDSDGNLLNIAPYFETPAIRAEAVAKLS